MYELHNVTPGASGVSLPPRTYYAVAIAPSSALDVVLVDGHVVGPGAPLLLNGTKKALNVTRVRGSTAAAVLLGVTDRCGVGALPAHRAPQRIDHKLTASGASTLSTIAVDVPGRRHHKVGIYTGATGTTLTVVGRIYSTRSGVADLTYTLVNARAVGSAVDAFEIGGTDHEEAWDRLEFTVTVGAAVAAGFLDVHSFGELGR